MADPLFNTDQVQYWWLFVVLVFMIVTPWLVSLSNKKDRKKGPHRDQEGPEADSKDSDLDLKE